jgi:antitoxin MazE
MRAQVKKWGDSASVRLPAALMAAASLHIDQEVNLREEDGRIVIEPVTSPEFDLDALLAGMSENNFPDDVNFGAPVGGEVW